MTTPKDSGIPLEEFEKMHGQGQGQRRPFVDTRVRSEPKPRFATPIPTIAEGDVSRWVGRTPTPIQFVIDQLVPQGMTTLLVSHGGCGKTTISQMALTSVAANRPALGRVTTTGRAAGVFAEDPAEVLFVRQERINEYFGVSMEELSGKLFPQSYAGTDCVLWRGGTTTKFFDALEAQLQRVPDLRLLAIDNVALVFADNENDRVAVSGFLNALNGLSARLGCATLLSTHTSKSTEGEGNRLASGSTAWINGSRSVLTLKTDDNDPGRAQLKIAKANHTKPGEVIELVWQNGVLVPEERPSGVFAGIASRNAEAAFLRALDALQRQGRYASESKGGRYAPRLLLGMPEVAGLKLRDLETAMNSLFAKGEIIVGEVGKYANRTPIKGIRRAAQSAQKPDQSFCADGSDFDLSD